MTGAARVDAIHDQYGTWAGDANLDGEFNSSDMIVVFQAGLYETGAAALWANGDFDVDLHGCHMPANRST